jgi:hypothetical protein
MLAVEWDAEVCVYPIPPLPMSLPYKTRSPVVPLSHPLLPQLPNSFSVARPKILAIECLHSTAECCNLWSIMYCTQIFAGKPTPLTVLGVNVAA